MSVSATQAPVSHPHPLDFNWTRGTFNRVYSAITHPESMGIAKVIAAFVAGIAALVVFVFEAVVYIPRAGYRCEDYYSIPDVADPL